MLYQQDLQVNTPGARWGTSTPRASRASVTYTVGFGVNSNLLKNTAEVGGGLYFTADNGPALQQALQSIITDVQTRSESCSITP